MHSNAAAVRPEHCPNQHQKVFSHRVQEFVDRSQQCPVGKSISCSQGSPFSGGRVNQAPSVDNPQQRRSIRGRKAGRAAAIRARRRWFTSVRAEPKRTAGVSSPPLFSAA